MWAGHKQRRIQAPFNLEINSSKSPGFFEGSGFGSSLINLLTLRGSPSGGVDQRSTALTNLVSIQRINMLSRSHTPVVQIARGPAE